MSKRYLSVSPFGLACCLCMASVWFPALAPAQPPPPLPPAGPDDETALATLKKQLEGAAPQTAIDAYQKFWNSHLNMDPNTGIGLTLTISDLYADKLHQPDQALKTDDWAIQQYQAAPAEVWLLEHKMRMLSAAKRYAEAAQVPENNWSAVVRGGQYREGWVVMYAATSLRDADGDFTALGEPEESVSLITKALTEMPALWNDTAQGQGGWRNGWMYEALTTHLMEANQPDAALGWARLNFAVCPFDKLSLDRATQLLRKVWATNGDFGAIHKFTAAQTDFLVKNPLTGIKPPPLDTATLQAQMERLRGDGKVLDRAKTVDLISVLMVMGNLREAMTQAQRLQVDNPASPEGALQVCRVFKAADLNTRRAYAYISYLGGQGPNPLPAFFKEHKNDGALAGTA